MRLEQQLLYEPRFQERQRVYTIVDLEYLSASALYGISGPLGGSGPLTIRDFPASGFQLHLHGPDLDHIRYGKVVDYERNTLKELDGYEASMADLWADKLDIKKILRDL